VTTDSSAPVPIANNDGGAALTPLAQSAQVPAPIADTPSADTQASDPAQSNGLPTEGILALLAALGIGAAGFAAMRSRRQRTDEDRVAEGAAVEPVAVADPEVVTNEPVVERAPVAVPAAATAAYVARPEQPREPERIATELPLATGAASTQDVLGEGPVPTDHVARAELLDRMVAAKPDEANPFTSRPRRRRRARVILQHREHLQRQGQPFDWRTYKPTAKQEETAPAEPVIA